MAGLREAVLNRDGRRCQTCPNLERGKLCVHHPAPGVSRLDLMITLCTACHAIAERTQMVLGEMTPLLLRTTPPRGARRESIDHFSTGGPWDMLPFK